MAPLAALIARLKGAKLVIQTHGIEAWPRPPRLQRAALEAADLVLCVSRYTRAGAVLGRRRYRARARPRRPEYRGRGIYTRRELVTSCSVGP